MRRQRRGRPGLAPAAPLIKSAENHYAIGMTASSGEGFQGQHEEDVAIFYDEGVGIDKIYFESGDTMVQGPNSFKMISYNPTDSSSAAYQEEMSGLYDVHILSVLDHPNINAELQGKDPPFPSAVRLRWVDQMVAKHCELIHKDHVTAIDFAWPTLQSDGTRKIQYYRPNAIFEARVLGRWASTPATAIWSDALFQACLENRLPIKRGAPLVLGCDVAREGDDDTTFCARQGMSVIHADWISGLTRVPFIVNRLIWLVHEMVRPGVDPKSVPIIVDDTGVGGGVVDGLLDAGYNAIGINAATLALDSLHYHRKRDELWFTLQGSALAGEVDFSRLSPEAAQRLRRELMVPKWKPDNQARRVVEPKPSIKTRLGSSPDLADGMNLCFYVPGEGTIKVTQSEESKRLEEESKIW